MILFGGMVKIVGAWSVSQECMSLGGVLYYWIGRSWRCLMWSNGLPKDVVYLQFCNSRASWAWYRIE